jgi:hypothetical protein
VCFLDTTNSALKTPFAHTSTRAPDRIESAKDLSWLLRMPALGVQPGGNGMSGIGAKSMEPDNRAPGSSTDVPGVGYR